MCQAAVVAWEAAGVRGGAIVNISSITATLAAHESPSYHAAKAGVEQITRYVAAAAGPHGIRVNAVAPGFIVQDEHRARFAQDDNEAFRDTVIRTHPLREPGGSDDIAEAVLYLASDRSRWVSGQTIIVDGGASIQEHWTLLDRNMRPQ
jgi:3-oxoacyl-[acyl-carrier protein] reductase